MDNRYNHLNEYYKNKFGERVLKISVDGGFTCPNRDGKCGTGGCIFCGDLGGGKSGRISGIKEQILAHLNSYRGERANKFIAYFQNFTGTYDTVSNLKAKYDQAIESSDKIVGLSIATRPDCIDDSVAKLIASYKDKVYVQVELGFQTANERTAKLVNRGYDNAVFTRAVEILNKHGIDVVVHVMVGLPYENLSDVAFTVDFINKHKIKGIKIHSTYVLKDTPLEKMYSCGEYVPITLEEYIKSVVYIITHISKDLTVHRISGDAPKDSLVAPLWNTHKKKVLNGVEKALKENDLYQGKFYGE